MQPRVEPFVFIGGTSEPGGLHVHTADVAMAVAAAGHDVSILCPSIDYFSPMFADGQIKVEAIPPQRLDESTLRYWRKRLAHHPGATAVLCRGKLGEGALVDLLAIRLASRRLVTIEHRDFDRPWPYSESPFLHGLATRMLVQRVIAVSPGIADSAFAVLKIPCTRIVTCLNWVDPLFRRVLPQERRAAKERFGWPPEAIVIGYHGRLAPEKRIDALLEAATRVQIMQTRSVVIAVVGDGWKRKELEEKAAALGISDRVRFMGWHSNPFSAISTFDIAVLPSLFEGFPLGLMEAMATGAACLAHPTASTRLLINSGKNGVLADLHDTTSFARALTNLIEYTDEKRQSLGDAAAETISREFSRQRRLPDVLHALGIRDAESVVARMPAHTRRLEFVRQNR